MIPTSLIHRLPKYLTLMQALSKDGQKWVSSQELARALGLTSSTVRQDLSHLDYSGTPKRGYETESLEKILAEVLGSDISRGMVVVGAGNIGRAIASHQDFCTRGFMILGIFDSNPALFGSKVGSLVVQGMDALPGVVRKRNIDIGVVAVPAAAAQKVADQLVSAGVRGLLNLACTHIHTTENVPVVEVRLIAGLQELAYAIKMQDL
jgi:redox-sensing transcriptional repressor